MQFFFFANTVIVFCLWAKEILSELPLVGFGSACVA